MSYDPIDIAGSALSSERLRMDIIASNIANINTTHNSSGEPQAYRRRMAVFKTVYDEVTSNGSVTVENIIEDSAPLRRAYDPGHPDADADGYVAYPNIILSREMVDMVAAKTAYQANITSIQTYKSLYNAALEI